VTVRRLRRAETRSTALTSYPNGWGFTDPAAIPPPGLFQMQRAGVPVTAHTSMQVDAVFTCIRVITNAVIKMGNPRAYKIATDDLNRPYRQWLPTQPGILTSTWGPQWQFDGMARTVVSLALFGEAFWVTLTRDYLGFPSALEVLHPAFVEVKVDEQGNTQFYYGTGVQKVKLDPNDVTHIPFIAFPGARRGLSSIEYAGVAFALALAAMEYGQRWFTQGASPSFILSTDQKLGQDEVERIAEKFLVQHSGLQSAHLPLVVDSGLKADKVSATPDEAQFIATLDYARMAIGAWFGLPSHLIGVANDKANIWGKTVQEMGFQLQDYTFSGYTTRLNEAFSSLLPRGTFAALDESEISRANAADSAAEIMALRQTTVATANDIRVTRLKWPPAPGGDELQAPLASNVAPSTPDASNAVEAADKEDNAGSNSQE
jgi:HK97 family phage portal protein